MKIPENNHPTVMPRVGFPPPYTALALAVTALLAMVPGASAQAPSINFSASTPDASYELRDRIPVTVNIVNSTPAQTDGAGAAAANAAATAQNVRITKVRLLGSDIYGNAVTISSTSYAAPTININDLSYSVPDIRGNLGPASNIDYVLQISIPNDGTLHDVVSPGYRVEVTLEWNIPGGGAGVLVRTTNPNSLISVTPNLQLPSVTCQPNPTEFRGGEVVRFNSFIRNSLTGDGTKQSRPMRSVAGDRFRVVTHLTTDPGYGTNTANSDDYQLYFTEILGDLGLSPAPDAQSEIRVIRVFDTPIALPAYGDPDPAIGPLPNTTSRIYTPQPDDGFLDIGEILNIEYDVLVPQNFPGIYFIAGMVDSLSQIDEPLGFNPPRESPPREATALVNDNTFLDPTATKFVITSTGYDNSPDVGIVSGTINESTGAVATVANNDSDLPAISGQGEVVAFVSYATNLASGDSVTNGRRHIYAQIQDPQSGALSTVVVSRASGATGAIGNGDSFNPMVSSDGRFVVFESNATNLVAGDTNGQTDIFVRDLLLNVTTRVSLNSGGLQAAGSSLSPSISSNGRYVAFHSNARNLASNPTSTDLWGYYQIFVVDRDTDGDNIFDEKGATATYLASVNPLNRPANASAFTGRISGNGSYLAYISRATNLDFATAGLFHSSVYRIPLRKGAPVIADLEVISRATGVAGAVGNAESYEVSINEDGRHIAYSSNATNLVANDNNGVSDVFVRDSSTAGAPKTVRVSVSSERAATGVITVLGSVALTPPPNNIPPDNVVAGNTVAFGPIATPRATLTFGGAAPDPAVGAQATDSRNNLAASINSVLGVLPSLGIAAESSTPVIPLPLFTVSPTAYNPSIFLISLTPGATGNEDVTVSPSMLATPMAGGGTEANDPAVAVVGIPFGSSMPSISADGRFVAFRSVATNLDVYRPDSRENPLQPPRTRLRNGERIRPLFNAAGNVYVHDRRIDGTSTFDTAGNFGSTRVSVSKFGYPTTALLSTPSSANNHAPSISANGQYVAFSSDAENNGGIIFGRTNLRPLDSNGFRDVFVMNRRFAGTQQEAPRRAQTIAFAALPSPRFGSTTTIDLEAVASSGLPITYTSSDTSVARVKGSTLTIIGAGSCTITASQAGDSSWKPETQARKLVVQKGKQRIAFNPSFKISGGYLLPSFAPRNSSAGLPIKYRSANPKVAQVLSGNIIKLIGSGYTTITATQPGNRNWEAAEPVKRKVGRPRN